MKKTIIASNNEGKISEFREIFKSFAIEIVPQSEYAVKEAAESGLTFVENAIIKARNACAHTKLSAIADDSGLVVAALNGRPGIHSARFAGKNATSKDNVEKLIAELKNIPANKRNAKFVCVLVYLQHEKDPSPIIATGEWHGEIILKPKGNSGFGYDPIFYSPKHKCTAAEMLGEQKNKVSHRAIATHELIKKLNERKS